MNLNVRLTSPGVYHTLPEYRSIIDVEQLLAGSLTAPRHATVRGLSIRAERRCQCDVSIVFSMKTGVTCYTVEKYATEDCDAWSSVRTALQNTTVKYLYYKVRFVR